MDRHRPPRACQCHWLKPGYIALEAPLSSHGRGRRLESQLYMTEEHPLPRYELTVYKRRSGQDNILCGAESYLARADNPSETRRPIVMPRHFGRQFCDLMRALPSPWGIDRRAGPIIPYAIPTWYLYPSSDLDGFEPRSPCALVPGTPSYKVRVHSTTLEPNKQALNQRGINEDQ